MNLSATWLDRIERLANLRDESLDQLLDRMELDRRVVRRICESSAGPDWLLLRKIADHFEITLDDLIDGRIDEEWVRNPQLHESFRAERGSKLRTSLPVLRWIEAQYGRSSAESLLRAMRVPARTLADPNQPVRLRLLCNLIRAAKARGISDEAIFSMGLGAVDIPENQVIRDALANQTQPKSLYESFFGDLITQFESNYTYRIERLESESMVLRISANPECILENGADVVTDHSLSLYRWGVTAGLLKALRLPNATVSPVLPAEGSNCEEVVRLTWSPKSHAAIPLSSRRKPSPISPSVG